MINKGLGSQIINKRLLKLICPERKPYMVGSVRLSDLFGFEDTVKGGVRGCFIPYGPNPSLYLGQNRQTGGLTLNLDILVRETANSRTGSSHFIKLSVGKANRERLGISREAVDALKIVGNLYTRQPESAGQDRGGGSSRGEARPVRESGDWGIPAGQPSGRDGGGAPDTAHGYRGPDMPDFGPADTQPGW